MIQFQNSDNNAYIEELREAFNFIDRNNKGEITVDEFYQLLQNLGLNSILNIEEIKKLFKSVNSSKNGQTITFNVFMFLYNS